MKAALVAFAIRPIWTHDIGDLATQLPADTPCRDRFVALGRLTVFAHALRYQGEDKPPRKPTAQEVEGWVAEIEGLKADFERWLETRQDGGDR